VILALFDMVKRHSSGCFWSAGTEDISPGEFGLERSQEQSWELFGSKEPILQDKAQILERL
jgi:hypothetical protein